ncbi:hypothetical protein [Streptomyces inhibens]|uniref:hypothetical protein n=1 Tax=Streptomyces inhibens TaxID=2293571 RepID=UPI001EE70A69|nr:hypothetical protein [Streptomyces inhibens]UKY47851.1 hypothetical protein KI385_02745 [Streptomyces inhibens]
MLNAATALCLVLGGMAVTATPAAAQSSGHLGFSNKGWFLVKTCYKWQGSTTPDSCDDNKPIGTDWGVDIPADAQGARIEVSVHGHQIGDLDSPQITDLNRNYCYELNGYTWNPTITEKSC